AAPNFADPADQLARRLGAPDLTGPFFVSIAVFGLAAVALALFLRPDPLLTARSLAPEAPGAGEAATGGMAAAWRAMRSDASARLAVGAMATGHMVMVGVMAMTPVHIGMAGMGHGDADVLRIVGFVLSAHVAGMYALSPVVGAAADRFGRRA